MHLPPHLSVGLRSERNGLSADGSPPVARVHPGELAAPDMGDPFAQCTTNALRATTSSPRARLRAMIATVPPRANASTRAYRAPSTASVIKPSDSASQTALVSRRTPAAPRRTAPVGATAASRI